MKKIKEEKGQSTIEFLVSFTIALGFVFSFLKLAIVYTNGYLVHYVTYLTSRAYMSYEHDVNNPNGSDGPAKTHATKVFDSYNIPGIIPDFSGAPIFEDPLSSSGPTRLYVGVRVEYQETITIPGTNKKISFPFISESYLGMEPTRAECKARICDAMADIGTGAGCEKHSTVSDNGC
ncbi:MAG: hypothetical protein K9K67_03030 [Bacteriovoracaceae bacterium]|nr:hypothetical protein [Bacteriovoracaceae bacterium]